MMNDLAIYNQYASFMQTGDCLRYDGTDLLDEAIKIFSPGCNHVGAILRYGPYLSLKLGAPQGTTTDRRWTIEADVGGVQINLLSPIVASFEGHIWWMPLLPQYAALRDQMGAFALNQKGKPYDYWGLISHIWSEPKMRTDRYICSSLTYEIWASAGIVPQLSYEPTPEQDVELDIFGPAVQLV